MIVARIRRLLKTPRLLKLLGLIGGLAFAVPRFAFADALDFFGIGNVLFSVIGKLIFGISWFVSAVAGIGVAVESWVIAIMLGINTQITDSPVVSLGFPVVLQIANLVFVLGIIVIAIATILRLEHYGIKHVLWKLLVMAVMVNFGLVICAPLLGFSNSMSLYFLNAIDPGGGIGTGAAGTITAWSNFAVAIAGAFNPQAGFLINGKCAQLGGSDNLFGSLGSDVGQMVVPITSLFFVIMSLVGILVILGVLIVTLLHRYVEIGVLLVLLPLAWASWAFPSFSDNYKKWWGRFTKQLFYPPLVIFFLWLGIQTSYSLSQAFPASSLCPWAPNSASNSAEIKTIASLPSLNIADVLGVKTAFAASGSTAAIGGTYNFSEYTSASNPIWGAVSGFFGGLFSPLVENFLRMLIVLGVMTGGIAASKELGVKGFETAEKALGSVSGGIKDWAGGKAKRIATRPLRGERGTGEAFRGWLQKPGKYTITNFIKKPLQYAGRGLEGIAAEGGLAEVKKANEALSKMTSDRLARGMSSFTNVERMAAIELLKTRGDLNKISAVAWQSYVDGKTEKDNAKLKNEYKRFGQTKLLEEVENNKGANSEMVRAIKSGNKTMALEVARTFVGSMTKTKASKIEVDHLFGDKDVFGLENQELKTMRGIILQAAAERNEKIVSSMLANTRGDSGENFMQEYKAAINGSDKLTPKEKEERLKSFEGTVAHMVMSGGHEAHGDESEHGKEGDHGGGKKGGGNTIVLQTSGTSSNTGAHAAAGTHTTHSS